jgi:hypothetical protein
MSHKTIECNVGHRGTKVMPWSEACIHMKVADKEMEFEIVSEHSVQLYKDGQPFSSTITIGEAGIFVDISEGFYYHVPDTGK